LPTFNNDKVSIHSFFHFLALFLLSHCQRNGENQPFLSEPAVETDLADVKKRGYLEAILENNSISYFNYKGNPHEL
jgi:membrane-bound lytic murein transglycosylase F